MQLAVERSQADVAAQAWLFDRRLAEGDIAASFIHLDAALRANQRLLPVFFPTIEALLGVEGGPVALTGLLGTDPPWRGAALRALTREPADPLVALPIFQTLLESPRSPTPSELNPYLDRLIRDGFVQQAYALWRASLPEERRIDGTGLVNGDFEQVLSGTPFDWRLGSVRGARLEISDAQRASGQMSLEIEFLDTRVAFRHVQQLLLLEPGKYHLKGKFLTHALRTVRGLRWRITCLGRGGRLLGSSNPLLDGAGWREFDLIFNVPGKGCPAQWLTLVLPARIASERQIAGQIWLDGLQIEPDQQIGPRGID
jgi:hypothetical protein